MKKIVCSGYGAALLKDPSKIRRILSDLRENLNDDVKLSCKIRIGYDEPENYMEIAKIAEELDLSHITVHGRTRKQLYGGLADWNFIREIKNEISIPVIGNGDIFTAKDAIEKIEFSKVDGVMLARGIFGNPWLIRDIREMLEYGYVKNKVTETERVEMAILHIKSTMQDNADKPFIFDVRKHICWYLKGVKNSATIKNEINTLSSYEDVLLALERLKNSIGV